MNKLRYKTQIMIFLTLAVFVISSTGWASTYYVDFAKGSDSNNGKATSTPFKHAPGDDNATSNALSTTLAAGDKVIFKGGVEYFGTINLKWSGDSDNSRIIYNGNSAGTWGTGRAIIDNQNSEVYTVGFYAPSSVNYITIKNFEFRDIGGYATLPAPNGCASPVSTGKPGIGISIFRGGSYINIEDSYFHEIGEWHNQDPFTSNVVAGYGGTGIGLQNVDHVVIDNAEFTKMSIGIGIKANGGNTISDIEVQNSDFHNYLRWGIDVAPRGNFATIKNISIHNNKIHDYAEYDAVNWLGCGEKPHTDGIFVRNPYMQNITWGDINIYNNEFYNLTTSGGGTAAVYLSYGPNANIYNNTFVNTLHGRTIFINGVPTIGSTMPQVVGIYNNSFYNNHVSVALKQFSLGATKVYIKNNIFYHTAVAYSTVDVYVEDVDSAPAELDYNQYYTFSPYVVRWTAWNNFTQVRTDWGWETHGQYSDPKYVDISYGLGAHSNKNNLRLKADSPAIGAGADLSGLGISALNFDKDGTPRPKGSAWDIGAYEYKSVPSVPSNLSISK